MGPLPRMLPAAMLFMIWLSPALSQDGLQKTDPGQRLASYSAFAVPHKLYLHLDREAYRAGETIWFKTYLFDAISHSPVTSRSNLFVELINSEGNAMAIRILLAEEGVARGDIKLPYNIPDGNYLLRAYTDWMRNFGEDNFYSRYLYIENPEYENVIPRGDVRRNRRFNRNIEQMGREYQVAFFPEGGNLLEGTANRVAFKVADALGRGQEAEGEIVDGRGRVVSTFRTGFAGMGVFDISPQPGTAYIARVAVNGRRHADYGFPEAVPEGYAMRVDQSGDGIIIGISHNVSPGSSLYSDRLTIIGHTRGMPRYAETFALADGIIEITVNKGLFPSGIAHFTLFTDSFEPVAERLVFIDRGDALTFEPLSVKIDEQDHFVISLEVSDHSGNPVTGNFSLAAVSGIQPGYSRSGNIVSELLLTSDLDGVVEDPAAYFPNSGKQSGSADLLLMTHGWRRFDWNRVIAGELPEIRYSPEAGLNIGGRLMDPAKNESLVNYPVRLRVKSGYDDEFDTITGRNGQFMFAGLFYEGMVQMELSSRRLPANYPPLIELGARPGRGYEYRPGIYTLRQRITERGSNWERTLVVSSSPYDYSDDRHVTPQLYGVPDQTIFIDYATSTERSLLEVLRNRATGIVFEGNRLTIRGSSSIYLSSEPRFMIDGMFVNRDAFLNLYPRDVQRVEIFRGTSAAIFGVRGGTGVILAYTRRPGYGGFEDTVEIMMLGYHEPAEYYSDIVSLPGSPLSGSRTGQTVHWEPELISGTNGKLDIRFPAVRGIERIAIIVEGTGTGGKQGAYWLTIDVDD